MTTTAQTILTRVTKLLQDPTFVRWPLTELHGYLSDGQREICLFKPNTYVVLGNIQLVAGTKQTLPAGGLMLLDVIRNRGSAGTTEGDAIRVVAREILDAQLPGWHSVTAAGTAKHYTYNPLDPTTFYIYPPQPTPPHYVEALYGATPAVLSAGANSGLELSDYSAVNITIADIWQNVLINYVMFRAYSKDAEYAQNGNLAQKYYELFMNAVSGKTAAEVGANPNIVMSGFNPNVPGAAK